MESSRRVYWFRPEAAGAGTDATRRGGRRRGSGGGRSGRDDRASRVHVAGGGATAGGKDVEVASWADIVADLKTEVTNSCEQIRLGVDIGGVIVAKYGLEWQCACRVRASQCGICVAWLAVCVGLLQG